MELVIDHLTRMRDQYICVAGLTADGHHVRPVVHGARWTRNWLRENGGPFTIGGRVELGDPRQVGSRPEVEDHLVDPAALTSNGRLRDGEFWDLLAANSKPTLSACFGSDLARTTTGRASVPVGGGFASLGLVQVNGAEFRASRSSLRVEFQDPDLGALDLAIADVRMHNPDGTVRMPTVGPCARRLASARRLILAIGLSRPFRPGGHAEESHWLQVNNLHFEDYLDDHPTLRR